MDSFLKLFSDHPEFLLNASLVHNVLHDYYQQDIPSLNIMTMSYSSIDVLGQIKKEHPDLAMEKNSWVKRLQYELQINQPAAEKAVKQWSVLFTKNMMKKVKEAENKKNQEAIRIAGIMEQVEQLIEDGNIEEASDLLDQIGKRSSNNTRYVELLSGIASVKKSTASQKQQALDEFGDGIFSSYEEGMERVTHVLDLYPDSQQAKKWLNDNPRTTHVSYPRLSLTGEGKQCTITWKDEDPYVRYTVCRAKGRYPKDLKDGICICEEENNKKITDTLPIDQPGAIWYYSIFAVRMLDGQSIKTDCPGEAIWLPAPSDVKIKLMKSTQGRPVIRLSWKPELLDNGGVQIIRKDNDKNDFNFITSKLEADCSSDELKKAQSYGMLDDYDVFPGITYRYTIQRIWKKGVYTYKSLVITVEQTV